MVLFFDVNTSVGEYSSDSKEVDVSSPQADNQHSGRSGGSTSGSGGPIQIAKNDFYTSLSEIRAARDRVSETSFILINNISQEKYVNITLKIEGIFRNFYNLSPERISLLSAGENLTVNITLRVPGYFPLGAKDAELIISSSGRDDIVKRFRLIVYDYSFKQSDCLDEAESYLDILSGNGIDIADKTALYAKASEDYNNSDFGEVDAFCKDMSSYYKTFLVLVNSTAKIEGAIADLKVSGYNTTDIEGFVSLIHKSMMSGKLDEAEELVKRATMLAESKKHYEMPMRLRIIDFYNSNKGILILILVAIPVILFISGRIIYVNRNDNLINSLNSEKTEIDNLLKNIQSDFFVDNKISYDIYSAYIRKYKRRLGEIETNLVRCSLKKKNYMGMKSIDVRKEKERIIKLIEDVQDDYFVKKIIDKDSYEYLENTYQDAVGKLNESLGPRDIESEVTDESIDRAGLGSSHAKLNEGTKNSILSQHPMHNLEDEADGLNPGYRKSIAPTDKLEITADAISLNGDEGLSLNVAASELISDNADNPDSAGIIDDDSIIAGSDATASQGIPDDLPMIRIDITSIFTKKTDDMKAFYMKGRKAIYSIEELAIVLETISEVDFSEYVNHEKNDFANWISGVFWLEDLAESVRGSGTAKDMQTKIFEYFREK
jgi:hypothetical protein